MHNVFHVSLLEPWHSRDGSEELPMSVQLDDEGTPEWEVEKILDQRTRKGKREYLVQWQGWPQSYNQWELEEHLEGAQLLLQRFRGSEAAPRRKRAKANVRSS